jgi:putative cardiolipin synthase
VESLLSAADRAQIARLATDAQRVNRDPATIAYVYALHDSTFVRDWNQKSLVPLWAATRVISDDPDKGLGLVAREALMFYKVREIIGESSMQVDLVSPYFVPTAAGVDVLVALAKRGVKVRILTNALEATDVAVVHAGYAKWRKALLQNGIALYELRRLSPDMGPTRSAGRLSSSGASLHAKIFSVDRARVFIGSFNFDPRSVELNTEMGVVIDSPALGQMIDAALTARIASTAYEVRLSDDGQLYWIERSESEWVRYDTEPGTDAWQRARVSFLSMLPVEWLL